MSLNNNLKFNCEKRFLNKLSKFRKKIIETISARMAFAPDFPETHIKLPDYYLFFVGCMSAAEKLKMSNVA